MSPSLTRWRYHGRQQLANAFDDFRISRPIAVGLTPEGGAVLVYENNEEKDRVASFSPNRDIHSSKAKEWADHHEQYRKLYDFLLLQDGEDREVGRKVSMCIGNAGSWFARRGDQVAYHNLPKRLELEIDKKRDVDVYPRQVTLGTGGDYVALWSDDSPPSWSLAPNNRAAEHLDGEEKINTCVISP